MGRPTLYGNEASVYVRSVRLTLLEKACPFDLVEVDPFAAEGLPEAHWKRHPFGKVPTFEHDGVALYETSAILRYADEVLPGPELTPETPVLRARMNQVLSLVDQHAYPSWVWGLFMQQVQLPALGGAPDAAIIEANREPAARALHAIADLCQGNGPYLLGAQPSLADLHVLPMFVLLGLSPIGRELIAAEPRLGAWAESMSARDSVRATRSPLESA